MAELLQPGERRKQGLSDLLNKKRNETPFYRNDTKEFDVTSRTWGFTKFISKDVVYREGSEYMSEARSVTIGANIY